jgi:hypothetical protein
MPTCEAAANMTAAAATSEAGGDGGGGCELTEKEGGVKEAKRLGQSRGEAENRVEEDKEAEEKDKDEEVLQEAFGCFTLRFATKEVGLKREALVGEGSSVFLSSFSSFS